MKINNRAEQKQLNDRGEGPRVIGALVFTKIDPRMVEDIIAETIGIGKNGDSRDEDKEEENYGKNPIYKNNREKTKKWTKKL